MFVTLFTVCFVVCFSDRVELWSTEHLLDLIQHDALRKTVSATRSATIALYETSCKNRLYKDIGYTDSGLPNGLSFLVASFDISFASNSWYEFDDSTMNLFTYYNISYKNIPKSQWCPTILFQHQNWNKPIEIYNPSKNDFINWVWNNLKVKVKFKNKLNFIVNLFIIYKDKHKNILNEQLIGSVEANSENTIDNIHSGDIIVAMNLENEVLNRYLINTVTNLIKITKSNDENIINYEKYTKDLQSKYSLQQAQDWSTRRRYLNNLRTPPLMPAFTESGFKLTTVPDDICKYITQFAKENKQHARKEGFPSDGTQINAREIPTYMMHIPPRKKQWIAKKLKAILEEWSGVKLVYSTIYGCREYRTGAVLKSHVDRIETHIISAIIHVSHSPSLDIAPWPLELTSFDGKRYYIQDDVCSLVLYESSKLIHGRPIVYNGTSWVNAFLHYRPDYWDSHKYKFTPNNVVQTPQGQKHLVDFVYG